MKKMTTLLVAMGIGSSAMAATSTNTITNNIKDVYQGLKASPASLYLANEAYQNRDDNNKINGVNNLFYGDLGYAINPNNKLTLGTTSKYNKIEGQEISEFKLDDVRIQYDRKNILTEANNGVYLNARLNLYANTHNQNDRTGSANLRVYTGKSLTEKLSLDIQGRAYLNDRKNGNADNAVAQYRLYTGTTYSVTDKWNVGALAIFMHTQTKEAINNNETLILEANTSYAFNDTFSVDMYVDATTHDGARNLQTNKDWQDKLDYGLVLNANVF